MRRCSADFAARNPPPDVAEWTDIADPRERLRRALRALYGYYERTEAMLSNVLRDAETMPALREEVAYRRQWLAQVQERLAQGWDGDADQVRHAIALAADFRTWQGRRAPAPPELRRSDPANGGNGPRSRRHVGATCSALAQRSIPPGLRERGRSGASGAWLSRKRLLLLPRRFLAEQVRRVAADVGVARRPTA